MLQHQVENQLGLYDTLTRYIGTEPSEPPSGVDTISDFHFTQKNCDFFVWEQCPVKNSEAMAPWTMNIYLKVCVITD